MDQPLRRRKSRQRNVKRCVQCAICNVQYAGREHEAVLEAFGSQKVGLRQLISDRNPRAPRQQISRDFTCRRFGFFSLLVRMKLAGSDVACSMYICQVTPYLEYVEINRSF